MFDTTLPREVQVADPFHVVRLANTALESASGQLGLGLAVVAATAIAIGIAIGVHFL